MGILWLFLVLLINTLYHDDQQEKSRQCSTFVFSITQSFLKKIMGNDWNPDAPDVNKEFYRAEQTTQKPLLPRPRIAVFRYGLLD